jgi:hypothetical protein
LQAIQRDEKAHQHHDQTLHHKLRNAFFPANLFRKQPKSQQDQGTYDKINPKHEHIKLFPLR